MANFDWRAIGPGNTAQYLDAIARAQQTTQQGIQGLGNAFNTFYGDLKNQNTNQMLTALNQATNPDELAIAQQQIAQMQQRFGNGYDLDKVRTAMDERPNVLMQRQSAEMDFNDKRASLAARPEINAAMIDAYRNAGMDTTQLQAMMNNGLDNSQLANNLFNAFTNDRNYTSQQAQQQFSNNLALRGEDRADRQLQLSELNSQMQAANTIYANYEAPTSGYDADGNLVESSGGYGRFGQAMGMVGSILSNFGPKATAMVHTESNFNPNARSPKGASGIIQIMPATAKKPGYGMQPINLQTATPEQQIAWGMEYRSRIQKAHGFTEDQATAAFNAGPGNVQQAIAKGGKNWVNHVPKETRDYVQKVNARERQYASGNLGGGSNSGVTVPSNVVQGIRANYQKELVDYNAKRGKSDQKVNLNAVLADLTSNAKHTYLSKDGFDVAEAIRNDGKSAGLSEAGIREVYNRVEAWRKQPQGLLGLNTDGVLGKSVSNVINEVLRTEDANRKQMDSLEHPSVKYGLAMKQAYEAAGGRADDKQALRLLDENLYNQQYGKKTTASTPKKNGNTKPVNGSTVKVQKSNPNAATARVQELAKSIGDRNEVNRQAKIKAQEAKIKANATAATTPKRLPNPSTPTPLVARGNQPKVTNAQLKGKTFEDVVEEWKRNNR